MKKTLSIFFLLFIIFTNSWATHVIGGDISVEWISQNNYKIHANIYRDDIAGLATMPASLTVGIYEIGTNNLVTTVNVPRISMSIVPLGDQCYSPDPNAIRIQEGVFESSFNVNIPNSTTGNGYYVQTEIYARNTIAVNLDNFNDYGMTFYCEIPDPAIGQNSSPQFSNYPADAYFCINSNKTFNFNTTDPDGDSLVYSLVTPLSSNTTAGGNFTTAGSGAYPYYPTVPWNVGGGYSLSNIVGGSSPMSIDPVTGDITAIPSIQGVFTFAVRVEEYRNGVKIGEIRRDVQYNSLNCTSGNAPSFLNTVPVMGQTIQIPYNKLYCKDLIFSDANATDTLYFEMISPIFDSGAYIPTLTPDINGDYHYFYDYNGTSWNDSVVIPPNQFDATLNSYWNIGTVANRFCWTPKCNQIGETFPFQVNAFSLGCDGKSQDSILFNIEVMPPVVDFKSIPDEDIPYGQNYCRDISFKDTSIVDQLQITVNSSIFDLGASFPNLSNTYAYNDSVITNVPNSAASTEYLGAQVCWIPDCEQIGQTYNVTARLRSLDCPSGIDELISFDLSVTPPFDTLEVIPNIFSPNGDGMNDVFKVGGISNPCDDEISISIFDRWGKLVYESDEPEFEWDGKNKGGKEVASGTYFIIIQGVFAGEKIDLEKRIVTVLR